MKKILFAFAVALLSLGAMAQNHLSFKNIPIDGPLPSFTAKLKNAGFTQSRVNTPDGIWFLGKFAGRDCQILVQSTASSQTVYAVYALFTPRNEWKMAKADYKALKDALTKKYGTPKSKEEFEKNYKEDGDEFRHMKNGHVVWKSDFDTSLGTISLYIKEQTIYSGCAIIQYRDKINSAKAAEELTDDL